MPAGVYVRTEEIHFKPKICARCGKEFKPTDNNQKYCEECIPIVRREKMREYSKKWRQRNLDKARECIKNWKEEHLDKVRELAKKQNNKRHRNLGFIPLNEYFQGADAHHIDKNYVIYIPKEVHQSIYHSVLKNINMDEINAVAFNYL